MQGMHYYGGSVASDPREKSKGWLTAFDASTGKSAGNTPRPRRSSPASSRPPAGFFSPATSTTTSSLWMPRPEDVSIASTPAAASVAA